jgi:hypothetical protein
MIDVLGMPQGYVDKAPAHRRQSLIETAINGCLSDATCQGVGGEGAGSTAEHVARELIEEDD